MVSIMEPDTGGDAESQKWGRAIWGTGYQVELNMKLCRQSHHTLSNTLSARPVNF